MLSAIKCPHCGTPKNVDCTPEQVRIINSKTGMLFCKDCFLLMNVAIDQNTNQVRSISKIETTNLCIHSILLDQDLFFSETLMPKSVSDSFTQLIRTVKHSNEDGSISKIIPEMVSIFNEYPFQVVASMSYIGLAIMLDPFVTLCSRCGLAYPKTRGVDCPYCKNVANISINDCVRNRLRFMIIERQQKTLELQKLISDMKSTGVGGILHILSGDGQTSLLHMQQIKTRGEEIRNELRKIDFEIQQLQLEITNKKTESVAQEKMFCRYCGIPNETDAVFCKKCGKKIG